MHNNTVSFTMTVIPEILQTLVRNEWFSINTIEYLESKKKKKSLGTRIYKGGREVKLRAGAVSSLRAVMRGVASRFLACHNRRLSLAQSDGRTDGRPAGWLMAARVGIIYTT